MTSKIVFDAFNGDEVAAKKMIEALQKTSHKAKRKDKDKDKDEDEED